MLVMVAVIITGTVSLPSTADSAHADPPRPTARFADVPTDGVHAPAIARLVEAGAIKGKSSDRFDPGGRLTRGQLATILARSLDVPKASTTSRFTDIAGSVHAPAIEALAHQGIVSGTTNRTFSPSRPVTRAQTAAMLVRIDGYGSRSPMNAAVKRGGHDDRVTGADISKRFPEVRGHAFERELIWASLLGYLAGDTDGRLQPDTSVTRAQAASLLSRFLDRQRGESSGSWGDRHSDHAGSNGSSTDERPDRDNGRDEQPGDRNNGRDERPADRNDGQSGDRRTDRDRPSESGQPSSDWQSAFNSGDINQLRDWYERNTGHEANGYRVSDLQRVGHLVTSHDGQVIEGVHADSIRIAHNNVTIRNSRITSSGGSGSYGLAYQDTWGQRVGGTLVEYVTFDGWEHGGNVDHAAYMAAGSGGATIRRANISGYSSGVSMRANTTFEESWVHDLYRGPGSGHGTSSTIRGPGNAVIGNLLEGPGGSSAVSLYADTGGPLHEARVEYNVMNDAYPYYQINIPNREHIATSQNVTIRSNRFGPSAATPAITGSDNLSHRTAVVSDNRAF